MQACWQDESDNLQLKKLAAAAYALHWHARVLDSARLIEKKKRPKKRPRQ